LSVVNIQPYNTIAVNQLQLGVQTDWQNWIGLVGIPIYGELLREANVKLIRVFDFRSTTPPLMPCIYWDEATKTGTWDWTNVDAFTRRVFEIGAEPLFCLGWAMAEDKMPNVIPQGMVLDPVTKLPYPESYAAYARGWVKHFKEVGLAVRYYEIMNEPFAYFGWTPDATKLRYFTDLYRATYQAMKAENPNLVIANDFNTRKQVLDYWLSQGVEMDSLNFHKYDSGVIDPSDPSYKTDSQLFMDAENTHFGVDPLGRSVMGSQQVYYNTKGKVLPIINSESNLNSHWETGTDIRNENICGAVWLSLVLRMSILNGLSYHVYFTMAGSYNWERTAKPMDGAGFGFINSDNRKPWAPYYVYRMVGPNLDVGDKVVQVNVADARLRATAWIHRDKLNVLLINKSHDNIEVSISGVSGTCNYMKIDETMPFDDMRVEEGTVNAESIALSGYSVMLLQTQYIGPRKYIFKQWQDGDTSPTKTIIV
jgi:hypothetical protein